MVVFFDQRGVSVYHKNIAHCTSSTSLNKNSNVETYANTINICSICWLKSANFVNVIKYNTYRLFFEGFSFN